MQPPGGRLECYSILGHHATDSAGFPLYDDGFVGTLVHEAGHGYVNPLANARRADFERSAPRVHAQVAGAMNAQAYPWTSMVNESLLHAVEARYAEAHQGPSVLPKFFADQRRQSWFWVEELYNLYGDYVADRRSYPTFAAFMPRVIAYFDSLPQPVMFEIMPESVVEYPSETILFGEKQEEQGDFLMDLRTGNEVTVLDQSRHPGGANYAFADASARSLAFGKCLSPVNLWGVTPGARNNP